MRAALSLQFKVFGTRLNLAFCASYLIFSVAFLAGNIQKYYAFEAEKSEFLKYEAKKTHHYQNYDQYGAYGFNVLFQPSPLSVFLDLQDFVFLTSNIDTKEIMSLASNYSDQLGTSGNLTIFMQYFSIFIIVFAGINIFPGDPKKLVHIIRFGILKIYFAKLFLYLLFFAGVQALNLFVAYAAGIRLAPHEVHFYMLYGLYFMLTQAVYFSITVIIASYFRKKHYKAFAAIALIFSLILGFAILPKPQAGINENEKNQRKLKNIMQFEGEKKKEVDDLAPQTSEEKQAIQKGMADEFMRTVYLENLALEDRHTDQIKSAYKKYEAISVWFPGAFINVLSSELSSKGKMGIVKFREYLKKLRYNFLLYYKEKRFSKENLGNVVIKNFIMENENIFQAVPSIPGKYYLSLVFSFLLFTLITGSIAFRTESLKNGEISEKKQQIGGLKIGETYFFRYTDESQKYELINSLPNCLFVSRVGVDDIGETGIKPMWLLKYMADINKVDFQQIKSKTREIVPGGRSWDFFFIGYLLVRIEAVPKKAETIIIQDYLKGSDPDLNKKFQEHLIKDKHIILYVSREMFYAPRGASGAENKIIPIDLSSVIFK